MNFHLSRITELGLLSFGHREMKSISAAMLLALLSPATALATAGYFQLGYGLNAKGMGGVGIAFPQDALAAATNPAGMVWIGNRLDAGIEMYVVDRGSEFVGNTRALLGSHDANGGGKAFLVPEFGFNRMLNPKLSIGLSVFGNGGSTRYNDNPFGNLGPRLTSPTGFEFVQAVAAPAFALKLGESHSVGVALNLVVQQFAAQGLGLFADSFYSVSPGNVTNRGRDYSTGWGPRFGWLSRISDKVSLGATYQPKIRMGKFDRYQGLLARQGSFDVPENYGLGIALDATPALTVAADIVQINFASAGGIGDRADCFLANTCLLGASNGPGPGWRNTTVYKLGVAYKVRPGVTLRAGVATLRQPIPADQTLLNIFAPAVSEKHLTLGATWRLQERWELTAGYMHAFRNTVAGSGSIPGTSSTFGGVGGGEANLRMKQDALGISVGWKY